MVFVNRTGAEKLKYIIIINIKFICNSHKLLYTVIFALARIERTEEKSGRRQALHVKSTFHHADVEPQGPPYRDI